MRKPVALAGQLSALVICVLLAGCQQSYNSPGYGPYALGKNVVQRQPWNYNGARGWAVRTTHYCIYTTVASRLDQYLFGRTLEAAYARFKRLAPLTTEPLPLRVYIFRHRAQWDTFTRKNMGQNAKLYLDIVAGAYTQHGVAVAYWLGRVSTLSVIAHEAWHQCSWFGFKNHLPAWLEEGLATQNEAISWRHGTPTFVPAQNYPRWLALRLAVKQRRLWTIHDLTRVHAGEVVRLPQKDINSYYSELWSLALFLEHSRYRPRLLRLLRAAEVGRLVRLLRGTGISPAEAAAFTQRWNAVAGPLYLHAYINSSSATLQSQYFAFVRRLTAHWPPRLRQVMKR